MTELIKVTVENNQQLVSARDLHKELNIKTRFSLWTKQNFKYFKKEIDFTPVVVTTEVPNNGGFQVMELQDYALTLDMAKHIAMMAGTDKGFEVRDYFIQVEKAWNSPEMVMKRALSYANIKVEKLETQIESMQPKIDYYDNVMKNPCLISTTEIAKRYGWGAVTLHKKLHELGVIYRKGNVWHVYAKYAKSEYADRQENAKGAGTLKWTYKGEKFIYDLLKGQGIVPIIERPRADEQLELEEQFEYHGRYFTASEVAWKLHLPKVDARLIGKLANIHHLKPTFTDSNKYCRVVVDEDGFETFEYTALGAMALERALEAEGYI